MKEFIINYKFNPSVYKSILKKNLPIYHITPKKNIDSIISTGLLKGNSIGICCVLVNDPVIIEHIVKTQLAIEAEEDYAIITIFPKEINLTFQELVRDGSIELSNSLHIYLNREKIQINKENIIYEVYNLTLESDETDFLKSVHENIREINLKNNS